MLRGGRGPGAGLEALMIRQDVIRAGAVALGVAAVWLPAELGAQHRGGGGHRGGPGRGDGTPPAVGTTRAGASQGSGGGVVGVTVRGRGFRGGQGAGFGQGLGQGVGYNLGQGLKVPAGGASFFGSPTPRYRGSDYTMRSRYRGGSFGGFYAYQAPYYYAQPATYVIVPVAVEAQAAAPEPVYYAPAGILRKPPTTFSPGTTEGYPMGRYPVVIRRATKGADRTAPRPAAAADSAPAATPSTTRAVGGFLIEEFVSGVVKLRWPDDGRGAREVILFTADRSGQMLASQTVRAAPYAALFDLAAQPAAHVGVTIVRPDGTRRTTSVPYGRD